MLCYIIQLCHLCIAAEKVLPQQSDHRPGATEDDQRQQDAKETKARVDTEDTDIAIDYVLTECHSQIRETDCEDYPQYHA